MSLNPIFRINYLLIEWATIHYTQHVKLKSCPVNAFEVIKFLAHAKMTGVLQNRHKWMAECLAISFGVEAQTTFIEVRMNFVPFSSLPIQEAFRESANYSILEAFLDGRSMYGLSAYQSIKSQRTTTHDLSRANRELGAA